MRIPKPLKTRRVSTSDHEGVFGQGEKALRVGLYARVSTHDLKTLPLQLSTMRNYVKKSLWSVAVEVQDVGSGDTPPAGEAHRGGPPAGCTTQVFPIVSEASLVNMRDRLPGQPTAA